MTKLELLGCYAIVAAALVVVVLLAWQLLMPPRPERELDWKTAIEMQDEINDRNSQARYYAGLLGLDSSHVQVFDGKRLVGIDDVGKELHIERPEPVRESFRRMLEGGPDYYRGD